MDLAVNRNLLKVECEMKDADKAFKIKQTMSTEGWQLIEENIYNLIRSHELQLRLQVGNSAEVARLIGVKQGLELAMEYQARFISKFEKPKILQAAEDAIHSLQAKMRDAFNDFSPSPEKKQN